MFDSYSDNGTVRGALIYSENGLAVYHTEAKYSDQGKQLDVSRGHFYEVFLDDQDIVTVDFQDGPVNLNGVNGLTNEALLAILIHRTQALDSMYPCEENKLATSSMQLALDLFNRRTTDRKCRQVEGTYSV